jgi:hypothetical protein
MILEVVTFQAKMLARVTLPETTLCPTGLAPNGYGAGGSAKSLSRLTSADYRRYEEADKAGSPAEQGFEYRTPLGQIARVSIFAHD